MGLNFSNSFLKSCIEDDYAECGIPCKQNFGRIMDKKDLEIDLCCQNSKRNVNEPERFSPVGVNEITGDFFKDSEKKRKVIFKDIVSVILIPTISELRSANLLSLLYYTDESINKFKENYELNIKLICLIKNIDITEAIKILDG